jgi:hypothetical protein
MLNSGSAKLPPPLPPLSNCDDDDDEDDDGDDGDKVLVDDDDDDDEAGAGESTLDTAVAPGGASLSSPNTNALPSCHVGPRRDDADDDDDVCICDECSTPTMLAIDTSESSAHRPSCNVSATGLAGGIGTTPRSISLPSTNNDAIAAPCDELDRGA